MHFFKVGLFMIVLSFSESILAEHVWAGAWSTIKQNPLDLARDSAEAGFFKVRQWQRQISNWWNN